MSVPFSWTQSTKAYAELLDRLRCLPSYRFLINQHSIIFILFWKFIFGENSISSTTYPFPVLNRDSFLSWFERLLVRVYRSSFLSGQRLWRLTSEQTCLFSFCSRTLLTAWHEILRRNARAMHFINASLDEIGYPHTFNRRPRDFSNFHKWKASELRCFFMYAVLPILVKLRLNMPDCFPEVYLSHFSLLFIYVRVLRYYDDVRDINNMPVFIHAYLRHFSGLYNQCKELYSVHSLVHLWQQVKQHGALAYHR